MNKFFAFISFVLLSYNSLAQSKIQLDFEVKKQYVSVKSLHNFNINELEDYVILDSDTLVNSTSYLQVNNIEKFCSYFKDLQSIITYASAIQFDLPNKNGVEEIKQWNSDIVVYVDKTIPLKIKHSFISFFSQIKNIDNFNISFTNQLKNANYLVKVSDTIISEEKSNNINDPYRHVTYSLITDDNKKFYAGTLLIDDSIIDNHTLALRKLMQMFYLSLGPFVIKESMPKTSLLSPEYNLSTDISEYDINLLKQHYYKIYPKPLNHKDLLSLVNKAQKHCKND